MNSTFHEKYTARGLIVREKIPVYEDSGKGMGTLWNRPNNLQPGEEIIGGHLVPEVLSESERENDRNDTVKYYVIYGKPEEVKESEHTDNNPVPAVSSK